MQGDMRRMPSGEPEGVLQAYWGQCGIYGMMLETRGWGYVKEAFGFDIMEYM